MNKTRQNPTPAANALSIEQQNAIELLVTGKSDRETAEACGVTRQTVNGWRNKNAAFMAELNRQRANLWTDQVERLRNMVPQALDVLADDLETGDPKLKQAAAVHILRAVGLYGTDWQPKGSTNPEKLALDMYFS